MNNLCNFLDGDYLLSWSRVAASVSAAVSLRIRSFKEGDNPAWIPFTINPALTFEPAFCVSSPDSHYVLAIGGLCRSQAVVLDISDVCSYLREQPQQPEADKPVVRLSPLAVDVIHEVSMLSCRKTSWKKDKSHFGRVSDTCIILDASWHPSNPQCVALLLADSYIYVFNVARDTNTPESIVSLRAMPHLSPESRKDGSSPRSYVRTDLFAPPASFCIVPHAKNHLPVLLVTHEDGRVTSMCPFFVNGTVISAEERNELLQTCSDNRETTDYLSLVLKENSATHSYTVTNPFDISVLPCLFELAPPCSASLLEFLPRTFVICPQPLTFVTFDGCSRFRCFTLDGPLLPIWESEVNPLCKAECSLVSSGKVSAAPESLRAFTSTVSVVIAQDSYDPETFVVLSPMSLDLVCVPHEELYCQDRKFYESRVFNICKLRASDCRNYHFVGTTLRHSKTEVSVIVSRSDGLTPLHKVSGFEAAKTLDVLLEQQDELISVLETASDSENLDDVEQVLVDITDKIEQLSSALSK